MRQFIVSAPETETEGVIRLAERTGAIDISVLPELNNKGRVSIHILVARDDRQELLDALQSRLGSGRNWRITLLPVETSLPFVEEEDKDQDENGRNQSSREEVYDAVWKQARTDSNYIIFVVLSTIVAAFGLISDNVAVVVGAMVIAPLLGPNLALAVGVALGDGRLMGRAIVTNLVGVALALALSFCIALFWPFDLNSHELTSRTEVGFDGMAVALASGAAAALSLVTGVSSALVGVMVAVALLPPTAAIGLFLGAGMPHLALGAAMLLAVNVVCVNLSAQVVMIVRGMTPRTFFEKKRARRASLINGTIWLGLLIALAALMSGQLPLEA